MANVQLSHDPFARQSVVRRIVETLRRCEWCGNHRHERNGYSKLFEYGSEPDG